MYVTYEFYSEEYGGKVTENSFKQLRLKAMSLINYYTFNRARLIDSSDIDLRLATCELIDHLYEDEKTEGKIISSETVGTWSRSYIVNQEKSSKIAYNIISKYLVHKGIMYRGGDSNVPPRYDDI